MSNKRVAINGFGRIGRLTFRAYLESGRNDLDFVAINDLGSAEMNAHLLQFDSVHGRYPGKIEVAAGRLETDGQDVAVLSQSVPEQLTQEHHVVSNASCTTNCLAPVAKVLNQAIGIKHGYMTTVHAYTGDQRVVDTLHKDPYRARASAVNLIPSSTGAAKVVGLVLPELKGKLDGASIRVPVPNVSLVDLTFQSARPTTAEEINQAVIKAANGPLKGVLGVNAKPLVSSDFNHDPLSSIFDLTGTHVVDETFCRVVAWYDNEWGFSNRMSDTAVAMGRLI